MALSKQITLKTNFGDDVVFNNAYIKVYNLMGDKTVLTEHLGGYKRATPAVKLFLALNALSMLHIEAFLLKMLNDDRLLRHADEVIMAITLGLQSVVDLSPLIWRRSALAVGVSEDELIDGVMECMLLSYGSLWHEVLRQLTQEPWCMLRGDIAENVRILAQRTSPISNDMVQRMKNMLDAGEPQDLLVDTLVLTQDAPTSIKVVEQAHAVAEELLTAESRASGKQVRARALMRPMASMLHDGVPRSVSFLRKQLARLLRRNPAKVNSSNLHFKEYREGQKLDKDCADGPSGKRLRNNALTVH